ncbi:MAG: hypothetical protein M3M99_05605 [Actinomycetota bacterium]|nr:hypothetical protein [Actinomycetota bacterium]
MTTDREQLLSSPISIGGEKKAFGEITSDDAEQLAAQFKELVGFGPTMRVQQVAMAWKEVGVQLRKQEAATVADLDEETIAKSAQRVWVEMPSGGGLMP